jgi:uncharacterized protein (DUF1778 family)
MVRPLPRRAELKSSDYIDGAAAAAMNLSEFMLSGSAKAARSLALLAGRGLV